MVSGLHMVDSYLVLVIHPSRLAEGASASQNPQSMGTWRLSDEALDEFIAIYEKEFKEKVSRVDAAKLAHDLLALYDLLSREPPSSS